MTHSFPVEPFRSIRRSTRLIKSELVEAAALQRRGRTIREIAEQLEVPMHCVEQSLYWDVVRK